MFGNVYLPQCDGKDSYKTGALKFIDAIKKLNSDMGISDRIDSIKKDDIPTLSKFAGREANPLYPVPKLMTRKQHSNFYYKVGGFYEKN